MNIQFKNKESQLIQVGDLMRNSDERKWQTFHSYFVAQKVTIGELLTPIHSPMNGDFIGNRVEDGVEIEWLSLEDETTFTMRYHRKALVEVSAEIVNDFTKLIAIEEHDEPIA